MITAVCIYVIIGASFGMLITTYDSTISMWFSVLLWPLGIYGVIKGAMEEFFDG